MRTIYFLALTLLAIELVPSGAHLFALPNKINLAQDEYFIAQSLYRGWALFGFVLIGAVLATAAVMIAVQHHRVPFLLALMALVCLLGTLAIFFSFTYPANQATSNWTSVPANWEELRWRWEMSHAANAVLTFAAFCSMTASLLTARD